MDTAGARREAALDRHKARFPVDRMEGLVDEWGLRVPRPVGDQRNERVE